MAVKLTERARSPRANKVIRFDVGPPGANANITNPAPIYGLEKLNKYIPIKIPNIGNKNICANNPARTGLGFLNNSPKSEIFNSRPMPIIIIASDNGKTTELRNVLSTFSP
jgi:hypothetical protein